MGKAAHEVLKNPGTQSDIQAPPFDRPQAGIRPLIGKARGNAKVNALANRKAARSGIPGDGGILERESTAPNRPDSHYLKSAG